MFVSTNCDRLSVLAQLCLVKVEKPKHPQIKGNVVSYLQAIYYNSIFVKTPRVLRLLSANSIIKQRTH